MTYARFRDSELAKALGPILTHPRTIEEMENLSKRGRPAVEAIGKKVASLKADLDNTEKQHVGRLVRDVMADRGLKPIRSARVRPGNLFSWGAVYAPASPARSMPSSRTGFAEAGRKRSMEDWLADVRAALASAPRPLMSVDEFIGQRRKDAGE